MRRHAFHCTHATRYSRALLLLLCTSACDADPDEQLRDAGSPLAPDGSELGSDAGAPADDHYEVAHVPTAGAFAGAGSLILDDGVTIDTTNLTVDGQTYEGGPGDDIVFDVWEQTLPGPELAVLHVYDFGIKSGTVTVNGTRPLVIIAGNEIRLAGMIEAAARGTQAGPGGFGSALGPGAGGQGQHAGAGQDGGGGGGGHGSAGAMGGSGVCVDNVCGTGGNGGVAFGTSNLDVLQGGAGGGAGSSLALNETCIPGPGGGGGGAVQLTAMDRIRIDAGGGVHAGGGGGRGGAFVGTGCNDNGAGGGGGAGGAIFLQAPAILHRGVLAANGGGGGSGASGNTFPGSNGLASDQPAPGGQEAASVAFAGGCGFARATTGCSQQGGSGDGNGGGGGGGVGRVVVVTGANGYDDGDSITSPAASITTR